MKLRLKYFYTILYIYIYIGCFSQNLVPNSSFENLFSCSSAIIENAQPWCGINGVGYFNTCISGSMSVPTQYFSPGYPSYQIPHSGNAYGEFGFIWPTTTTVSRYPQVKLIDTLEAGKMYCVTYYVSLWSDCKYSADKMGALLTATPFNCTVTSQNLYTGYTPQVVSPAGVLYNDTLGWQEVSGSFVANGTEAYLTLGNFFPNTSHTYSLSYPSGVRQLADYYLDDVSVEEVQIAKAKNDTLIYAMDSVIIGNNKNEAALFSWQPTAGLSCTNCPNPKASPSVNTTYTVTKTQCKVTTTDEITVSVSPVGITELGIKNAELIMLPNPANDVLHIASRFVFGKVELLGITGQVLLSEAVNNKSHELQLQNFAEGIYFVRVFYPNGLNVIKKVIVNH
jgi:hypothetical protein